MFCCKHRIYSNKRRGAYLIFGATSAALIRGRRLFKHCTRQIYFFYIVIQRYSFYLLIFLWTNTKLIVNQELRSEKRYREFHDNESENISGESELLCRCGTIYNVQSILKLFFLVILNSSNKRRIGGAALIRGWHLLSFLFQMWRLIEGGAYSSKYGNVLLMYNWI